MVLELLNAGGAAHVPSPLQKVEEVADVPELRLATGRLPETSEDRSTFVIVLLAPSIDLFVRTSLNLR